MKPIRVLLDSPATGSWNMAVDEVLLETAAATGQATLRFYQWQEPTLSLGYFQSAADRHLHPASAACPLVRRASGGGAILHDRELTYSFAVPPSSQLAKAARELYDICHLTLIDALVELGIQAALFSASDACNKTASSARQPEPFLCFQRRTCFDIVCGETKIVGSAQRRRRGAVLQHGSILLNQSPCAPELPGILEAAGRHLGPADLTSVWQPILLAKLAIAASPGELSPPETAEAQDLANSRFATPGFVARR